MPPLLLVPLGLLACQGLAGRWSGPLLCLGEAEVLEGQATLALVDDRGGEVDGELRTEGEYGSPTLRGALVWSWELELERTRLAGAQDLDHRLDGCLGWVDGALALETCPDEAQMTWTWDGADLLVLDGAGCSAELSR